MWVAVVSKNQEKEISYSFLALFLVQVKNIPHRLGMNVTEKALGLGISNLTVSSASQSTLQITTFHTPAPG